MSTETPSAQTVAVVTPYYWPSVGGVQHYARRIVDRLAAETGVRPIVVTTGTTRRVVSDSLDGVPVHRLPVLARLSNTGYHPRWRRQMREIFAAEQVRVINTHAPVPLFADAAIAAAGERPVVATYHSGSMVKGGSLVDPVLRAYERYRLPRLFDAAERVVAVSPTALGYGRPNAELISPGVDPEAFAPGPASRSRRVLYVGRLDRSSSWKGVDVLIAAFARLRLVVDDVELRLVGDGDAVPGLREHADRLGCLDAVTFVGHRSGRELVAEYQHAAVTVLPSLTEAESFGMTLVESMACGTPVIGSRVGGIVHVIRPDETGLLVPPGDVDALAGACRDVLTSPALSSRLAAAGRTAAVHSFAWDARLDRWSQLLSPERTDQRAGLEARTADTASRNAHQAGFGDPSGRRSP
ncbi:MAG TPA: glycosyltransferase family 4 protein [Microlunatus sp.]